MQHFPVFLNTLGTTIVVSGAQDCAVAKLRLLLKTQALIKVFGTDPVADVVTWAAEGRIEFTNRPMVDADIVGAVLCYAANDEPALDLAVAGFAKAQNVPVLVVDNLNASDFITPAIVDRDPVTIAIGTEGAAPVLARAIKADLEEMLPASVGILARIGKTLRPLVDHLPKGRLRRAFWQRFYFADGARALDKGKEYVQPALEKMVQEFETKAEVQNHVNFVGAGPGDPELLTLKARNALHDCDVVMYDQSVDPRILELARREAVLIAVNDCPWSRKSHQTRQQLQHHSKDKTVVRLMAGDCRDAADFHGEVETVSTADIAYSIIPGVSIGAQDNVWTHAALPVSVSVAPQFGKVA